ncbi:unnamed protein product [Phytophthora lilii]|uniref:Unnamed protein product n=1 Tax=Phytophthora lilii TaxID=2077276 RepID=A0A9W7CMN4_9STRA|nr:unnamed protein product [Phytophthora lilii]
MAMLLNTPSPRKACDLCPPKPTRRLAGFGALRKLQTEPRMKRVRLSPNLAKDLGAGLSFTNSSPSSTTLEDRLASNATLDA